LDKRSLSECDPERVLASLPPDTMDKLADLVVAKLKGTIPCSLLPKQDVVGSNPITRSRYSFTSKHQHCPMLKCYRGLEDRIWLLRRSL